MVKLIFCSSLVIAATIPQSPAEQPISQHGGIKLVDATIKQPSTVAASIPIKTSIIQASSEINHAPFDQIKGSEKINMGGIEGLGGTAAQIFPNNPAGPGPALPETSGRMITIPQAIEGQPGPPFEILHGFGNLEMGGGYVFPGFGISNVAIGNALPQDLEFLDLMRQQMRAQQKVQEQHKSQQNGQKTIRAGHNSSGQSSRRRSGSR